MKHEEIIERLALEPIDQEGGWFSRIHTGEPCETGRPISTTIYALFTREQFSALHRLDAVEQFFFLGGDAFEVFRIDAEGNGRSERLGPGTPHMVFQVGEWFGGQPIEDGDHGWTLMSCVVTPGFDWEGFEIGDREVLSSLYPKLSSSILSLTR